MKSMRCLSVRLSVLCASLLFCLPASARYNWMLLGENNRAEIYIDTFNVVRPAFHVKAWTLLSYKSRQRGGWISERRLFLFSCKDQTLEWQQSMYYAEAMGEGELVLARTLTKYGVTDLAFGQFDPNTKDKKIYRDAVPESNFTAVFKSLC
jgi:hypothetical protein